MKVGLSKVTILTLTFITIKISILLAFSTIITTLNNGTFIFFTLIWTIFLLLVLYMIINITRELNFFLK